MMMSHRMQHQPIPDTDPLHALGSEGTIPPDVYDHPEWYGWGDYLPAIRRILLAVRGRPDAPVRVFRAVPHGIDTINTGDWVSIVEGYARHHAMVSDDPADDWPVISAVVSAASVRTGGGDVVEWGYWGPDLAAEVLHDARRGDDA